MKKFISIALCIFWMGFIFYNSSESGMSSDGLSYKIVDKFIAIKEVIFSNENNITGKVENNQKIYAGVTSLGLSDAINNIVKSKDRTVLNNSLRKVAHCIEYLILAVLLTNAFGTFNIKPKKSLIYILFIVLFYAVTDEYHQLFVNGRSSKVTDVLIDFIGGIIGIVIFYITSYLGKKRRVFSK